MSPPAIAPGSSDRPLDAARGSRVLQGFAAFRYRNYRLFWFGQLVSLTGTWMQTMAQAWLVLTLTSSAFKLGLVNVCQFAPVLLLGLPAGVVADRVPKRALLVVTQSMAALLAACLTILVATDNVRLWHVYALATGLGIVNAFDMPTRQAFVSEMVDKPDLMNAVALNSALFNSSRILGPALAGVLLALFGPALCFGLNAASYLAVIAGLLLMRLAPRVRETRGSPAERLREGLAYVRGTPAVLMPIVLIGVVATFGMNFNVWIPLLAKQDLAIGAGGFGLLMSALGIGSLVGALTLAFGARRPNRHLMLGLAAALGALELVLALIGVISMPVAVAMLLLAGIGFSMSTTMAIANTTVQTTTPDELRGRAMSVYMTVFAGTAPIGSLVTGSIANRLGTPTSLAVCGATVLLGALGIEVFGRRSRRVREAERRGSGEVAGASVAASSKTSSPVTGD